MFSTIFFCSSMYNYSKIHTDNPRLNSLPEKVNLMKLLGVEFWFLRNENLFIEPSFKFTIKSKTTKKSMLDLTHHPAYDTIHHHRWRNHVNCLIRCEGAWLAKEETVPVLNQNFDSSTTLLYPWPIIAKFSPSLSRGAVALQ